MAHILCPLANSFFSSIFFVCLLLLLHQKISVVTQFSCCLFFILHFFVRISTKNQTIDTEKQLIFLSIEFFIRWTIIIWVCECDFHVVVQWKQQKMGTWELGKRYFRRRNRKTKEISCAYLLYLVTDIVPISNVLGFVLIGWLKCRVLWLIFFFRGRVQTDMNISQNAYTSMSSLSMQYKM